MRVLITRPAGTWPALQARFAGTPIVIQMTETTAQVDPIDARPGDAAVDRLDRYDWLVATSARGVSALSGLLARRGRSGLPAELHVAAVGPATARALAAIGARVDCVAENPSSDGVAAALGPRLFAGARVLLIRPEGAPGPLADALRGGGAVVDEAPLYRTIASGHASALADAAIAGEFAVVVFTAPSAIDLWLEAAGSRRGALASALARAARAAIGPTTAARLSSLGLPAAEVAEAPREEAVGDAIARLVRSIDLLT